MGTRGFYMEKMEGIAAALLRVLLGMAIEQQEAGTTATVALLRNSVQLAVAHVGDSRALMYRKGEASDCRCYYCCSD